MLANILFEHLLCAKSLLCAKHHTFISLFKLHKSPDEAGAVITYCL